MITLDQMRQAIRPPNKELLEQNLKTLCSSTFEEEQEFLSVVSYASTVFYGLNKYAPEHVESYLNEFPYFDYQCIEKYAEHVLTYLNYIFPIEFDMGIENFLTNDYRIQIEAQGGQNNWDWFSEMLENPTNTDRMSLFFLLILHGTGGSGWNYYNDLLEWDCHVEDDFDDIGYIDWIELEKDLKGSELSYVLSALNVEGNDSTSRFIYFNPHDEGSYTSVYDDVVFILTVDTLEQVRKEWEQAKVELDKADKGYALLRADNRNYKRFFDALIAHRMTKEDFYAKYRPGESIPTWG